MSHRAQRLAAVAFTVLLSLLCIAVGAGWTP